MTDIVNLEEIGLHIVGHYIHSSDNFHRLWNFVAVRLVPNCIIVL